MEHRSVTRVRTVLKAEIRYNDGLINTQCLVRDLSETGARLELPGDVPLPERFDLYIEKRKSTHRAIVKRRIGLEVGVEFENGATAATSLANATLLQRVTKLEADIAELRALFLQAVAVRQNSN